MGKHKLHAVANENLSKNWKDKKQQAPLSQNTQPLTFDAMIKKLTEIFNMFPDTRHKKNTRLHIKDASMAAFVVFFTQSPSFLSYQKRMQDEQGRNNAQSLFGIAEIISDSQIRRLLDKVPCSFAYPMFPLIFNGLLEEGFLDPFRSYHDNFLVALDVTGHHSSERINCPNCSEKHYQNGSIIYSHSVITPVMVHPGLNKVIAWRPEFIVPRMVMKNRIVRMRQPSVFLRPRDPLLKNCR